MNDSNKKLSLILQTIQSNDAMLIRKGLFNFTKLIEQNNEIINKYFNLSPNCIELFDDSVYKIVIKNVYLSSLWLNLIILILNNLKKHKTKRNNSIIYELSSLTLSSKYKMIILNLKSDQNIDSQCSVIKLFNQIGSISNQSLNLLIDCLQLNDDYLWLSFWNKCKYHTKSNQLIANCYNFAILIISSNNTKIISVMSLNKSFWNVIKTLLIEQKQKENEIILFKHVLRYFYCHKLTLNRNENNLLFLQFWLFVLLAIKNKFILNRLFKIASNIKNIYVYLKKFLFKIASNPNYIEILIQFFKQNDNSKFIINFIQKKQWNLSGDDKYFDELSLLNDLYKILDANATHINSKCIPLSFDTALLVSKLENPHIVTSYSAIHLLHWYINHQIINIVPSLSVLVDIYYHRNESFAEHLISNKKYQTLLTKLIILCLDLDLWTAEEDNCCCCLWQIISNNDNECDNNVLLDFIIKLNEQSTVWNYHNFIQVLHEIINLLIYNNNNDKKRIINFIINSVLPSNKQLVASEMSTFLNCICKNSKTNHHETKECVIFTVLLLSHLKFDNDSIYNKIKSKFPSYSLFIYVLYVISVSQKHYTNTKWFEQFYNVYNEFFIFNKQLAPNHNIKQIEQFFTLNLKMNLKEFALPSLPSSPSSSTISLTRILNYNFAEKYYYKNVCLLFIDICKMKGKNWRSIDEDYCHHITDECCLYFENICCYLTQSELIHLIPLLAIKLFEEHCLFPLYLKMLSSILKSIGKHHLGNKLLIKQIKHALNIKQLIERNIDIHSYLLYYMENNAITQIVNDLLTNNNKQWEKTNVFLKYICCDIKQFDNKYIYQFVDKLIVSPYLNNSYWLLLQAVFENNNNNNNKYGGYILQSLITKIDIDLIINKNNNNNISQILNILSFICDCGHFKDEHLNIFIIILQSKKKKYDFLNKSFFIFLQKCLLNYKLGQEISIILLFILNCYQNKQNDEENEEIIMYFLDTIHLCLKQNETLINNKEIILKLNGILFNKNMLNVKSFWKFLCDLSCLQTIAPYLKYHLNESILQRKVYDIVNIANYGIKMHVLSIINKFEINLEENIIYQLFNEFDGFYDEFNIELLKMIEWNNKNIDFDIFELLICQFSGYQKIEEKESNVENIIISWFNGLEGDILKIGPQTTLQTYDINFIWMAFKEIVYKINKENCGMCVRKIISSKLLNYILMGMNSNDLLIRQKCYALFDILYKFLYFMKRDSSIYYKWYFIIESLRLSIKKKHQQLPSQLINFIISSIYISANPLNSQYSVICDSFCTKTIIQRMQLPLQARILFTHFVDIEKHQTYLPTYYVKQQQNRKQKTNKYIKNRIISIAITN